VSCVTHAAEIYILDATSQVSKYDSLGA
jgi:hypothetical protein